jgi:hypothetical protein
MLGYVIAERRGQADRLLAEVAALLLAEGWPLAGAVQINSETDPALPCDMDLKILAPGQRVRISQNLGALSTSCRLDSAGLEQAVALVDRALDAAPRLLIVNKFGRAEAEGRGFRPLIGRALAMGLPVLTAVSTGQLVGFSAFAAGFGQALAPDAGAILAWCRAAAQ